MLLSKIRRRRGKAQTHGVNTINELNHKVRARNESSTRRWGTDGLSLDGGEEIGEEK